MVSTELDLKTLLDHDCQMALNFLESSGKLVQELKAAHYWTTYSLDIFTLLNNINSNIITLLDICDPFWANPAAAFQNEEAMKLWKTATGLWNALPTEQKKIAEQLSRRRRQRIMGEDFEEVADLDPDEVIADDKKFAELHGELTQKYQDLLARVASLPDKLVPSPADLEAAHTRQSRAAGAGDGEEPAAPAQQEAPPDAGDQDEELLVESEELPL